jgi:hypothetical protein
MSLIGRCVEARKEVLQRTNSKATPDSDRCGFTALEVMMTLRMSHTNSTELAIDLRSITEQIEEMSLLPNLVIKK